MGKYFFFLCIFISSSLCSQTVSWYETGQLVDWETQPDVFAFRLVSDTLDYSDLDSTMLDTTIIDGQNYWATRRDKAFEIYFKPSVSDNLKDSIKNLARSSPYFEIEYPVITKDTNKSWQDQEWYIVDDIVLVSFVDGDLSEDELESFMDSYGLLHFYEPPLDLQSLPNMCYGFLLDPTVYENTTAISTALEIVGNSSEIVSEATPNFSNLRFDHSKGYSSSPDIELEDQTEPATTCTTNDPYFNAMWHIENTGQYQVNFNSGAHLTPVSTLGADANICGCWDQGLSGSGITVGIISRGDWDFNHEDMTGSMLSGWDCSQGPCTQITSTTNLYNGPFGQRAAGTYLAGLIAAKGNNSTGTVGVSPNAQIQPFNVSETQAFGSWLAINAAFAKAMDEEVDIVMFSMWAGGVSNANFSLELQNAITNGRDINGIKYGIVVIATSGGYYGYAGGGFTTWPASHSEIISVIGSNPNDGLKTIIDGWDEEGPGQPGAYGCIPGEWNDVAAPTSLIFSTDMMNFSGSNQTGNYDVLLDQCPTAPAVVAGIAAMMLEYNPKTQWNDIKDYLIDGADQVGGYNYNFSGTGASWELAHGRVNCLNSLQLMPVAVQDSASILYDLRILNPIENEIVIINNGAPVAKHIDFEIHDLSGAIIYEGKIKGIGQEERISIPAIPSGLYVLKLKSAKLNEKTIKLVKL